MRVGIQLSRLRPFLLSPSFTEPRSRGGLLGSRFCSLPDGAQVGVTKIFGPAKPLLLRVGDRQPVQQTLVVPQRQRLWLVSRLSSSSFLTSCSRYNDTINIVPHITKTQTALLMALYSYVLFTDPARGFVAQRGVREKTELSWW